MHLYIPEKRKAKPLSRPQSTLCSPKLRITLAPARISAGTSEQCSDKEEREWRWWYEIWTTYKHWTLIISIKKRIHQVLISGFNPPPYYISAWTFRLLSRRAFARTALPRQNRSRRLPHVRHISSRHFWWRRGKKMPHASENRNVGWDSGAMCERASTRSRLCRVYTAPQRTKTRAFSPIREKREGITHRARERDRDWIETCNWHATIAQ